jgi:hypothetical protein
MYISKLRWYFPGEFYQFVGNDLSLCVLPSLFLTWCRVHSALQRAQRFVALGSWYCQSYRSYCGGLQGKSGVKKFIVGFPPLSYLSSRDSAVGIATGFGLDGRRVGVRVSIGEDLSFLDVVPTGSGAHLAIFLGVTLPGLTIRLQLMPRSRIRGSIHPLPHTPSWRSA